MEQQKAEIKNEYNTFFQDDINVSMHFRLGDYVGKEKYHPVMNVDYYENAINYLITKINTIFFSLFNFFVPRYMVLSINFFFKPFCFEKLRKILLYRF